MAKPNWIKIENEYTTGNISFRKLAEKYKISFNTLKDRAVKGKWAAKRVDCHNKIQIRTQQKSVEKISEVESDRNAKHIALWDKFLKKLEMAIDADFKKDVDNEGNVNYVDFDPKDLTAIAAALDKAQRGHRLAEGLDKDFADAPAPEINIINNLDSKKL